MKLLDIWHLCSAWRTPCGPKINHHLFTTQIRKFYFPTIQSFEFKIWCHISFFDTYICIFFLSAFICFNTKEIINCLTSQPSNCHYHDPFPQRSTPLLIPTPSLILLLIVCKNKSYYKLSSRFM